MDGSGTPALHDGMYRLIVELLLGLAVSGGGLSHRGVEQPDPIIHFVDDRHEHSVEVKMRVAHT